MAFLKRLTSWSFSRYSDYQQCPLKAKLKHIDKIKEPASPAMERGAAIHKQAEEYIKGTMALPEELTRFKDEFDKLRKLYKRKIPAMFVEDSWAFTADWTQTQWNDWANCVVRIKLDCAHEEVDGVLIVTDWKTGKFRESDTEKYLEQLELYALGAFLIKPSLKAVLPRLAYLDVGVIYPNTELRYTPKDVPRLKKLWAKRTGPMLVDTQFAPRPNQFCGWCHFRASNKANGGGQCQY